jgi:hypothetical protein
MTRARTGWLAFAAVVLTGCSSDDARSGVEVSGVLAPAPIIAGTPGEASMAVYATFVNHGPAEDTLTDVESMDARRASIHTTMDHGGMTMMMLAEHIVLPDDSTVRLAPGGVHVMLESLTRVILPGDSVAVTFVFRRSGRVNVMARVVAYDQIEQLLGASEAP